MKGKVNELFIYVAKTDFYSDINNNSIFGKKPELIIDNISDKVFFEVCKTVQNIVSACENEQNYDYDLINEIFGHFVRDNFRGNIEDAQYMTPAEVVDFMAEIAIEEVRRKKMTKQELTICDPCCGVGSFLSVLQSKLVKERTVENVNVIGQDKVERMARLTQINLALFDNLKNIVSCGNSLIGDSYLNRFENSVDIILTNPPFGAKFESKELKNEKIKYPLLNSIFDKDTGTFSSEVLFIDRCISLLKDGGILLAVVPDNVISASGVSSVLRQKILKTENITLRGIIELPAVTFAQAGTRTKTSILFLEKNKIKQNGVYVGKCNSLGFEVSIRKGVTNKYIEGINELPELLNGYKQINFNDLPINETQILTENPSSVLVNENVFRIESWTPTHFNVQRFKAIEKIKNKKGVKAVKLSEIASFESRFRKKGKDLENSHCISVLHVINGDMLSLEELFEYNPKYPGFLCEAGDLLFSKINPRIPRMLIVPDLGVPLTCSTEFEIIKGKNGVSNEELKAILSLPVVQNQIINLTSGTSSSHNRIKSKDLANVIVPIPLDSSVNSKEYDSLIEHLDKNYKKMMELNIQSYFVKQKLTKSF